MADPFSPSSLQAAMTQVLQSTPATHTVAVLGTKDGIVAGVAVKGDNGWTLHADAGIDRSRDWFADLAVVKSW
jgi:hypothetical protein